MYGVTIREFPHIEAVYPLVVPLPGFRDLISSNAYVLGTGPVTLIDTGPKFSGALQILEAKLMSAGLRFADVERIILTHGHMDHFGLVREVIRTAGHPIPCYLHADDIPKTTAAAVEKGFWEDEFFHFARYAGLSDDTVDRMKRRSAFFRHYCDPLDDVTPLRDGDVFEGPGYRVRAVHTPGHSPGSCCLYEEDKRLLFSGDHIIKHITPNPITEVNRSRLSDPEYKSLQAYERSIDRASGLNVRYAFPGHGEFIDDMPFIVRRYREHKATRQGQIHDLISGAGRTIYSLVGDIFPDVEETDLFLAVSEVFSHLEVLLDEGRAEKASSGPPALFRALQ